jgi:hypothetical protein
LILKYLIWFLQTVYENFDANKINANSLGIAFGISIFKVPLSLMKIN